MSEVIPLSPWRRGFSLLLHILKSRFFKKLLTIASVGCQANVLQFTTKVNRNGESESLEQTQDILPFAVGLIPEFLAALGHRREVVFPRIGPAAVNDRPGVFAFLPLGNDGIQGAAPALSHDVDITGGIASRRHRPGHIKKVGRIDILVHNDDKPVQVPACMGVRRNEPGLPGMSRIGLLDGNDIEEPASACFVAPDASSHSARRIFQALPRSTLTSRCLC